MVNKLILAAALMLACSVAHAQTLTGHWLEPGWTPAASTTVTAAVGNNATLTNAGNVDSIDDPSVPGTAFAQSLHFGQSDLNDGLEVAHVISGSTAHSVCMWVNPDNAASTSVRSILFGSAADTANISYGHSNASYIRVGYRAPDGYPFASYGSLTAGTWYHIAYVWDGSNLRVFKDGVQVGSDVATASTGASSVTCYIGNYPGYADGFEGKIVDVRTYSGALDATDIAAIMAEASSGPTITTSATQSLEESERDVVTVAATDGATPYVWSITGGSDQALFAINSSTGALTMPGSADFENPEDADTNNVYVVEVTCTDDDSETDALTLNVTVTDEGGAGTGFSAGVNNGPIR